MLLPQFRQNALEQLMVGDRTISVDLFASPQMRAVDTYITKGMDAFTYNWTELNSAENTILWANPPFKLLDKVVEKVQKEPCLLALCTPKWEDRPWWSTLSNIGTYVELPPHRRIFRGLYRKDPLKQNTWNSVVWLVDTIKTTFTKVPPPQRGTQHHVTQEHGCFTRGTG